MEGREGTLVCFERNGVRMEREGTNEEPEIVLTLCRFGRVVSWFRVCVFFKPVWTKPDRDKCDQSATGRGGRKGRKEGNGGKRRKRTGRWKMEGEGRWKGYYEMVSWKSLKRGRGGKLRSGRVSMLQFHLMV